VGSSIGWRHAPVATWAFVILHFSYGMGCLWGIIRFVILRGAGMQKPGDYCLTR
jgi:hypothetical protein